MTRLRVPDGVPDYESDEDLQRIIRTQIARLASNGIIYQERTDGAFVKWVLGLFGAAVLAAGTGMWSVSNNVSELKAQVASLQRQIDDLKRLIEPRYGVEK